MVSNSRKLVISSVLGGVKEDASKALLMSSIRDCSCRPVSGARFALIDGETGASVAMGTEPGDPQATYYEYALPNATCTFTSNKQQEAAWTMANAPVNASDGSTTHSYRLRLQGRMRASDIEPVVLGEREVELLAGNFGRPRRPLGGTKARARVCFDVWCTAATSATPHRLPRDTP